MIILYLLTAFSLSAMMLRIIKLNDNPNRLTLRGKRILFLVLIAFNLFACYLAVSLYWVG